MERRARVGDYAGDLIIRTPARICLFGDHQDYLGLPVIACTIDRYIQLEAHRIESNEFVLQMPDLDAERHISLEQTFDILSPRDYFSSAIRVLRRKGITIDLGYEVTITGDIPINSGLSSSTALSLAWIGFLCEAFSKDSYSSTEMAQFSYQAEVLEHGEPGGMMDQYTIAHGGVVHLETRDPFTVNTLNVDVPGLVIGDSGIAKKTIEVLQRARTGGIHALETALAFSDKRDVSALGYSDLEAVLPQIPSDLQCYLRAAIGNHEITQAALAELQSAQIDWHRIGALMNQHQDHLRDDLGVSVPALDKMIVAALRAGALGAKLVGSGGGGCIVALAPGREEEVRKAMQEAGAVDAFETKVSSGNKL